MNYQKYADKAYSKIKQYGSPIKITHSGSKQYDKATNTYTDTGSVVEGVAIQRNYSQNNINGTNVRAGDVQLMCALNGKPFTNDSIEFGSKKYTVVNVDVLSPDGGTDIFYTIQAR